jgi:hypothetical protein
MPLSFLYYHLAEQWPLVQQKMLASKKKHQRFPESLPFSGPQKKGHIVSPECYSGNNNHIISFAE